MESHCVRSADGNVHNQTQLDMRAAPGAMPVPMVQALNAETTQVDRSGC